jgi:hypothetical protein
MDSFMDGVIDIEVETGSVYIGTIDTIIVVHISYLRTTSFWVGEEEHMFVSLLYKVFSDKQIAFWELKTKHVPWLILIVYRV